MAAPKLVLAAQPLRDRTRAWTKMRDQLERARLIGDRVAIATLETRMAS